ncbi:MAG: type II toxin-antitoxin system RelE/ParE family toxin [Bacteroidia bacterium]
MVRKISWNERALDKFGKVTNYLLESWSANIADEFVEKALKDIDSLLEFPYIGRESEKNDSYRCLLITKHNLLIYRIEKKKIVIVNIVDTRQKSKRINY